MQNSASGPASHHTEHIAPEPLAAARKAADSLSANLKKNSSNFHRFFLASLEYRQISLL